MVNGVGFFCKPSLFQKPAKVHLKREIAGPDLWFNTWTKSFFLICEVLFQNTYFVRSVLIQIVMCVSFLKQVSFPFLAKLSYFQICTPKKDSNSSRSGILTISAKEAINISQFTPISI